MPAKVKEIGNVERLPEGGFIARVTRYGNGRKLPAPRILLDTSHGQGRPFTSGIKALDALNAWKSDPRSIAAHKGEIVPLPAKAAPRAPKAAAPAAPRQRVVRTAPPAPLPALERRATTIAAPRDRSETEALIRKARHGKRKLAVTRCPEYVNRSVPRSRGGGVLPAHLNPVTIS